MCIDYRELNSVTVKDAFPIPRIDDLLDKLKDAHCISHIDLQQGYYQLRVTDSSTTKHCTAFQGPNNTLLQYRVMPFGLCNAPASFQRAMQAVLAPVLGKFAIVYLDDICIFSRTPEDHLEHCRIVLQLLQKHHLFGKLSKCFWGRRELNYLGVIAGGGHIRPDPAKVRAVRDWPLPTTQKQAKSFVQFCSYYRRFVHHFSDCSAPLTSMTKKGMPTIVVWSAESLLAFEILKARMTAAPVLVLHETRSIAKFVLVTDVSNLGIGAVLLHDQGRGLHPVEYYARKLNSAEVPYIMLMILRLWLLLLQ